MHTSVANILNIKGDRTIWTIFVILSMFSILIVYSATESLAWKDRGGDTGYYLIKQFGLVLVGMLVVYLFHWMHYMKFSKWSPILLVLSPILLVYTLFFGKEINEAYRWLEVPFTGLTVQTSDFAKIALILYVARVISSKQEVIKDFWKGFIPVIAPIVIVCGCIAPADLSTALLLFVTCMVMMFIGRVDWKVLVGLFFTGIVAFSMLILVSQFYPNFARVSTWTERIHEFVNSADGGYQIQQAKIAIADGGLVGQGPGRSIQKNYLPSAHSDFIFATIIEEYGLIGACAVVGLYILFFVRVVKLVTLSPKAFGSMLAIGLSLLIIIQALMNLGVAVHLLPVTGLTLPLVSLGGTSLLFTCVSVGMILSVSRYVDKPAMVNA